MGLDFGVTFLEEDAVYEELRIEGCLVLLILGGISDIDLPSVVAELQALTEEAYSRTLRVDRAEVAEGELKLHTARLILDVAGLVEVPLAIVRGDDRRDDDGLVDERTPTLVEYLELADGVRGQGEFVRTLLLGTGRIDFVVLRAARSPYPDEHREGECIYSMTIHRIYACRGGLELEGGIEEERRPVDIGELRIEGAIELLRPVGGTDRADTELFVATIG